MRMTIRTPASSAAGTATIARKDFRTKTIQRNTISMKTPEGYEKADLDKFFKRLVKNGDVWLFKPMTAGFGKSGISDYVGCCRYKGGQFFSIEVKREGKNPTALQYHRMRNIEAAGGKTFWGTAVMVIIEFEAWIA